MSQFVLDISILYVNTYLYFILNVSSLVLPKCVHHMAPGHSLVIPFPFAEWTGSFCCCTIGIHASHLPCISCWEGLTAHRELMSTPETDILLSLLFVSKVFFTQCLTVLFSFVTLISGYSWQNCSDFDSRYWATDAACLTIWLLLKHYPTIFLNYIFIST